jgi:hypothetical protein
MRSKDKNNSGTYFTIDKKHSNVLFILNRGFILNAEEL